MKISEARALLAEKDARITELEMQFDAVANRLVEAEQQNIEVESLLQVLLCFIVKKFSTIANFKKLGGWRNIWLWASVVPFFVDFCVELVCRLKKNEKAACKGNEKRAKRLNKWCS